MGSRPRKGKYYTNIRRYGGTFKNRKIVQYPPRALLSTTVLHRPLGLSWVSRITKMTIFTEMTPRITGMTLQSTEMTPNPYFKKISPQIY